MNTEHAQKMFADIYAVEADAIFRFCVLRVSDREQATDLTQEVFTKFWVTLQEKGREIDHPRAFLYTIARNCIIDWYRKKKSVSLEGMTDPDSEEPYEPIADDAQSEIRLQGEGRFLVDAIGKLSSGHRDAVFLRYVEDLSPPEIGKILGISANAASVRISRGLDELKQITGYNIEENNDTGKI